MAAGVIAPNVWYNGTVATPAWFSAVSDTVNGISAGTIQHASIQVGTAYAAATPTAGRITASENISASGTLTSATATSKQVWISGLAWVGSPAGAVYTASKGYITSNGSVLLMAPINLPFSGSGSATVTSVKVYTSQNNVARTITVWQSDPTGGGADTSLGSAATPAVSGIQSATISGLTAVSSATLGLWVGAASLSNGESVVGALVTYTSAVF